MLRIPHTTITLNGNTVSINHTNVNKILLLNLIYVIIIQCYQCEPFQEIIVKITFRQIDAFKTVVSTGTVTETARMLGISQPAVSRLISDLEKEIGFKLFVRSGRNLKTTPEARLLIEEVRRVLIGLEQIKDSAVAIKNFQHAQLRLITTPTFSTMISPQLIRKFAKRRPEVIISLEVQSTDDTVEWMLAQNYDFGIAPSTIKNQTILGHPLFDTQSVCLLPKGHRLESSKQLTPKDISRESYISFMPNSLFRFEVDEVFRKAGVERRMRYEARTRDAICHLVAQGLGVSIVGMMDGERSTLNSYSAVPFKPNLPFKAALIWSKQRTMSLIAKDFLLMVEQEFSSP